MACRAIDDMRQQVCASLHGTVQTWEVDLQSKFGDPQVFEQQRVVQLKRDARVAHDISRRNTDLLQEAYARQSEKDVSGHKERLKNRVRTKDTPPESPATAQGSRTPQPRRPAPSQPA